MNWQKTRYPNVPRQTRSSGSARLVLPVAKLWSSFAGRFARAGLELVVSGAIPESYESDREAFDLHAEALSLAEWLPQKDSPPLEWDGTARGLTRLAAFAEDLAAESGAWRDELGDLEGGKQAAIEEFCGRAAGAVRHLARRDGPQAARAFLEELRQQLEEARDRCDASAEQWTAADSEALRQQAVRLRGWSRRRGLFGSLYLRAWPSGSFRWLLSDAQRRQLPRTLRAIDQAYAKRARMAVSEARRQVFAELLGDHGRLAEFLAPLAEDERQLASLARLLEPQTEADSATDEQEIELAGELETVLDPETGRTLEDLYNECLQKAGCRPESWAEQLRSGGLEIDGRLRRPQEWPRLEPAKVAAALLESAHAYLGSADSQALLDLADPRTALEHAAGITMLHPELRPLLHRRIAELVDRSRPYLEWDEVAGADPPVHAHLYCARRDRPVWEELLAGRLQIAEPGEGADYDLPHPHAVELVQIALGIPGGTLPSLAAWAAVGNDVRRLGLNEPHVDPRGYPEMRLLAEWPKEEDHCRRLLEAAEKAALVRAVGGEQSGLALSRPDPRLEPLFRRQSLVAQWREPAFFCRLLATETGFESFLRKTFGHIEELPVKLAELKGEHRSELLAEELCALGVLERGAAGQLRMTATPEAAAEDVPHGLYRRHSGPLTGLSRPRFQRALMENDLLYNILFWGVLDALRLGQLSRNDVPEAVRAKNDTFDEGYDFGSG